MNLNKWMLASMILTGLSACNNEDITSEKNENTNNLEGEAYMALSISMPSANGSRAVYPDMNEGTKGEQKISNLTICIWNKDESKLTIKHIKGDDLRPNEPNNPAAPDKSTVYTTDAIAVDKGAHKVIVIANGDEEELKKINTPAVFRQIQSLTSSTISSISRDNYFLMTNANTATSQNKNGNALKVSSTEKENGKFYEDGTVAVNVQGTKANPTSVVIPIERVVAKIEDRTNSYTFEVKNTSNKDQVIFERMALVNANTKFYLIKNIRPMENVAEVTDDYRPNEYGYYVVDPNFENQATATISDFLFNKIQWNDKENTALDLLEWKDLNTSNRSYFYALENTMIAKEQKNGYTTGLYYQAVYKVNGTNKGDNVYKFQGKVYSYKHLSELPDIQLNGLKDNSPAKDFYAIGVTKFEKGICYYPYWIRHINSKEDRAPMEFGVVRNNYYQMTINSVNGIGTPEPENPDPDTPDENPDTMLEVMVKVMPWTVRNNGIDF